MKAIRAARAGGPEVLEWVDVAEPQPGPGEVRVRHRAVGLNFIDTYQRSGLYPLKLPAILGLEAAGEVEAVGEGAERFAIGDRVAYNGQPGAYAQANVVKADRLVRLPDTISFETAAASSLKGMTAEFLTRIWPLAAGETVLVHAAAGGVGSILTAWLADRGVRVIGAVGSPAKAELARAQGCAEVILYDEEDVAAHTRALTNGRGVKVAYDSVGKATAEGSLKSLARRGLLVLYGNASGPPAPIDPLQLSRMGSLFVTRPTLYDYVAEPSELQASADSLWAALGRGTVKATIGQTFPLSEARAAHEALEARRTTGSTLLIP